MKSGRWFPLKDGKLPAIPAYPSTKQDILLVRAKLGQSFILGPVTIGLDRRGFARALP